MRYRFTLLLFTCVASIARATAQTPFSLLYSLTNPATNAQALGQGARVAIDTNFAVASAINMYGATAQAVTVYDATNGALRYTLLNPGQASSFGSCVAVSGTRVVVGNYDSHPLGAIGCVYVYDLASLKPTAPVLTLFNPEPSVVLGVAASGNYVVVRNPSQIYVYDLAVSTPTNPVVTIPARFSGDPVAISGTRVVVGAPRDYPPGNTNGGTAYVYDLASSTPTVPILTLQSPTPTQADFFGVSVAISGNRIVVGMDRGGTNAPGTSGGNAFVYDLASATPSIPIATLTNPKTSRRDYFGHSVGISGARVIVGTYGDGTTAATNVGSAYVYQLTSPTPTTPLATLNNPTPAAGDQFGQSVAISDTRVIVGAPGDDSVTTDAGSAYLYDVAGAQPAIPVARLASGPAAGPNCCGYGFGDNVAISSTRVIVGAAGSAHVYDLAGITPVVPSATLFDPTLGALRFGSSVAISGPWAVVGAYSVNPPGNAYVYDLNSTTPTVAVATLSASSGQGFGYSVAISGTRVAVGAPDAGRAYVYDLAGATPTQPVFALTNPGTAPGFGRAVAIAGTRLVVGASSNGQTNSAAYAYDLTTTPPGVLRLIDPAPSLAEMFGSSVAISGTRVVVGAYMVNWGFYTPGKAHIYDLARDNSAVAVATLLNPNPSKYPGFGYSVTVSGTRVVVSSVWQEYEDGTGKAYLYDFASATPTVPVATLSNPMIAGLDNFGWSVAADGMTVLVGSVEPPASGAAFVFGPNPRLTIAPSSTNSATISWAPANSPEFFLQSASNLTSSNWINASSGATHPVSIFLTNEARFYRLFSP